VSDRSAALLSNNFIYAAMVIYALAFLAHAVEVAWSVKTPAVLVKKTKLDFSKTERLGRLGSAFMVIGTLLLLAGVIFRGISANRVPWGNMYEFSITGALAFSIAYLYALKKYQMRWLGLPAAIAILLTLGTAVTLLYRPSAPLVPALKSPWLVIHVSVIAGAIWAEAAWGRYWGWDPKETWAFITWVAYAAYLHARVTIGWRGRKAAWLCLLAGSTFLFNYVYINVWGTGKHTYSGL